MPYTPSLTLPKARVCRKTHSSSACPSNAQHRANTNQNRALRLEINEEVRLWKASTLTLAMDLAHRFDKKPQYFLDLFFQGGVHLVHKQKKPNAYNAYKRMKAEVLRDQGETPTLGVLNSQELKDEYHSLTEVQREEIIAAHEKATLEHHRMRPTMKARMQDVSNTLKNMKSMLQSLNMQVGIEGFFCVVRNTPNYHMDPFWYFTSTAMKEYMPMAVPQKGWEIGYVGAKLEAFAIAGCNVINLNRTSKQKADDLKRQIREKINQMLCETTKNDKATMQYVNYKELIVQHYGVELVGWTYEKLVNPSKLLTSLTGLRQLFDAINNGDCKFVKISALELSARRIERQKKVDEGIIPTKTRKQRKDKGTKRKQDTKKTSGNSGISEENGDMLQAKRQRKGPKSAEAVCSESEEE